MNKHYPYRIKTKEEFINDYGESWRTANDNSHIMFVQEMDYLFGEVYPFDIDLNNYIIDDHLPNQNKLFHRSSLSSYRWIICKFMLTENKLLTPDYKPKNKIKRLI